MMEELEVIRAVLRVLCSLARLGLLIRELFRKRKSRREATRYRCEAEDNRPGG
jgi:hypothetical protein